MLLLDMTHVSQPCLAETVATLFPLNRREATSRVEEDVGSSHRRKLWEISAGHHCIVIGTCISMPELRRLARQAGVEQWKLFLSMSAALLAAQPGAQTQGGREKHVGDCSTKTGIKQARCERETLTARGIGDNDPRY